MVDLIPRVLNGVIAGTLGTLSMDLLWYRRYRSDQGTQSFLAWETSEDTDSYDTAAAPAQAAKAIAGFAGVELPNSSARTVNNVVHWATGIGWGVTHGAGAAILGTSTPLLGPVTGNVAWATSYIVLPRLGVYRPIGDYDSEVLWQDLSAHMVYGATLGLTFRLLVPRIANEGRMVLRKERQARCALQTWRLDIGIP